MLCTCFDITLRRLEASDGAVSAIRDISRAAYSAGYRRAMRIAG